MNYQPLYQVLTDLKADAWRDLIPQQLEQAFDLSVHGTAAKWFEIIERIPGNLPSVIELDKGQIQIGDASELDEEAKVTLLEELQAFHPWRKGPYDIYGIKIDTEWRSDWKWDRLKEHISPLKHRLVMDVGCGNGYHCWRMLGAGAKMVVGVEPLLLNVLQFHVIRKLHGEAPVYMIPVGLQDIPEGIKAFDTVFSMGVLYHRRSPIDHLLELKDCLRPGGELVLETLVIDGKEGEVLMPEGRYAKMRNVWFLPSCETLISWLKRCGFKNCRLIDVTNTSLEEQRATEWMRFNSLVDFLDPDNLELTCEGLPAPKRAIILADAP